LEAITAWFSKKAVEKRNNVTLISAKGSAMAGTWKFETRKDDHMELASNLTVLETIEPSWDESAEKTHYIIYKNILEKKYGEGHGVVWDNTWHCYSYNSVKNFPKIKILHTQHGVLEKLEFDLHNVKYPRFIGLSKSHAQYMSSALKIPVKYIHNGIRLPPPPATIKKFDLKEHSKYNVDSDNNGNSKNNNKEEENEGYLLSLNRIVPEKGIDDAIDLAVETRNHIKIAGDDRFSNQNYVKKIKEKCQNSNGYAEYYGLVNSCTKVELLKNCKAVIGCPKPWWMEAFGLYAVEANAYGKPVLALKNGGLLDIVVNGVNGFLAENLEELKQYMDMIDRCSPEACRKRIEEMFTDEKMTNSYLSLFEKVLEDRPEYCW
jgi:glycosyltransferase involved in cell wall biosynthesis